MIEIRGTGPAEFTDRLETVMSIYTAAMHPPAEQITGRQAIMRGHGAHPDFRCLFAELPDGTTAGFAYGFHGLPGQWWHDVVYQALQERSGTEVAEAWLGDSLELAEVHVHPDYQGKGIGRALVLALCEGRPERSAVLSTHDHPTAARHLYRSLGFTDLLTQFVFPGGYEHYAIAGAVLPLR
ncbi:GNAT family N-acetyltransferase [Nonomuraea dietziae]|uniref:Ribosomal protein S18 acetylase RimI-like enzyme n=1 Tax=Nonomuraea dietziae TaxID=65515 RepID=A0A7W5VC33_9ACTN|nr:GNAT family N-acetyltransferase [Nonomuraea dietziae]MBB3732131.1 ribosomal protein S18 acetylase RimI-like enzyme [Nonomuraea dietziae]